MARGLAAAIRNEDSINPWLTKLLMEVDALKDAPTPEEYATQIDECMRAAHNGHPDLYSERYMKLFDDLMFRTLDSLGYI